jgi:hypothetical protein
MLSSFKNQALNEAAIHGEVEKVKHAARMDMTPIRASVPASGSHHQDFTNPNMVRNYVINSMPISHQLTETRMIPPIILNIVF